MKAKGVHRILIVEDEPVLAGRLARHLESAFGYPAAIEGNGTEAVRRIVAEQPILVVLDVGLPGLDGFEVCRRVRSGYAGPILVLTATATAPDEQVKGLSIGADAYLTKPVAFEVLEAQLRALLRRTGALPAAEAHGAGRLPRELRLGPLRLRHPTHEAWLGDARLVLTGAEFEVLWLLASREGEICSRADLHPAATGRPWDGLSRRVDGLVMQLRRKLNGGKACPVQLVAVRGEGYLLTVADV